MPTIYGDLVDQESRCSHYHSQLDIIALKCFACRRFYACYLCHNSREDHSFAPYPISLSQDKPVICGACRTELTYSQYQAGSACPICQRSFNPGCKKHAHLYFKP